MQQTIKKSVTCKGIGLHSGANVKMTLHPAEENTGIVFYRSDVGRNEAVVAARWNRVVDTRLCTVIGNEFGNNIGTIEHLMAALRGCGIDNALVEIDGGEVPIMDGSSDYFVDMIKYAGIEELSHNRKLIKIIKEISVRSGDKSVTLSPADDSYFSAEINFDHKDIKKQSLEVKINDNNVFSDEIADCRTFGFLKEVEWMRANGLAKGGSLDNAIVLDDSGIVNPEGLRRSDEFVRHKILDAIGDIYLAGARIIGRYHGVYPGHEMNNRIIRAMFADMDSFEVVSEKNPALSTCLFSEKSRVKAEKSSQIGINV